MATFNGDEGNNTIVGGSDNDLIQGGGGADTVVGGTGNDAVDGNDGNDWVEGGAGNDTLTGAGGTDSFVFREAGAANADVVTDFASNWDDLRLDAAGFAAIGAVGRFAAGDVRFFAGAGATGGHDADDRIVYDTTTGQLFYDPDGNGAAPAQLIATINGAPAVVASDISVFGTATPPPPPPPSGTINGTAGNDSLVGTAGNDTIDGQAGNDTIDGNGGADVLIGGTGNDVISSGDFFNSSDPGDQLFGGDGDDTRDATHNHGSLNASTMDGGLGNDAYFVDNTRDVLTDAGGIDTVNARDINWTLGSGFENLVIDNQVSEGGRTGIGNELDNRMTVLWGGRLEGRGGNDTLLGTDRSETLLGGDGNDSLDGGGGGFRSDVLD